MAAFACAPRRGEYRAAQLVLAAGAWMRQLVPELAPVLAVTRQPIQWFEPSRPEEFAAAACPVTLWEHAPNRVFYTLPDFGDGVKAGVHHEGQPVDPDHVDRRTSPDEDARGDGPAAPVHAAREGASAGVAGVSLHEHAGPAFRDRRPPGAPEARRGRECVLGTRLQVRDGRRRGW